MARPEARLSAERIRLHEQRGEWPHSNLSTILESRLRETPDRVIFVSGDERVTPREIADRSGRLARGLARLGVGPGTVVSWQLPNWIEGVYLTYAIDRLGAISNPILPIYREREVAFIVRQAESRVLIVPGVLRGFDHRELARTVAAEAPSIEHVLVARAEPLPGQKRFEDLPAADESGTGEAELPSSPVGPHDVSFLFYTSGTTSDPKGVMHTISTLVSFVRLSATMSGTGPADEQVGILWFPLAHIGGIGSFAISPVMHGSRAVILEPFNPAVALDLIEREGVTSAGGPTPVLQAILSCPEFRPERMRTVRNSGIGATDVPPELMREVGEKFGAFVYRSYGMTECPMSTTGRRGDPEDRLIQTDGRAAPGVELRVVDEQGRPVSPGVEGEVELFGPQLCVGYLDGALTDAALTPDGFLRSGDLAVMDERGFVRITGRKKDIIIRKGENLSAKAIEDELYEHPKVVDAAVIGVPDAASGERVCACVVLAEGADSLTLPEVREFMLGRQVMAQKIPEQIEILPELPRNATGKVLKHELRRRFGRAQAARPSR